VSLILEALKKLDREKGTPDRGFLVLAHLQRPLQGKGRAWVLIVAAVGLAAAAVSGAAWWRGRAAPTAPTESGPSVDRAAPATASALPTTAWTTPIGPAPRSAAEPAPSAAASPAVVDPPEPTPSLKADIPTDLRLNAISRQDGRPVAILNDRLVREGDSFEGIRVLRIGEAEVEVEIAGVRRVIGF